MIAVCKAPSAAMVISRRLFWLSVNVTSDLTGRYGSLKQLLHIDDRIFEVVVF